MNEQEFNRWLDETTARLPRSIEPQRDLWPAIHARLSEAETPVASTGNNSPMSRVWPFAAGMAATALVAIMAIQIMRPSTDAPAEAPATAMAPAQLEPPEVLEVEPMWLTDVRRASNDLKPDYEASLDNLSPETREVVEENLAQIHESLEKIHEALAKDPSNAALHRLLAGTYQQELSLFSSIGALNKADVEL